MTDLPPTAPSPPRCPPPTPSTSTTWCRTPLSTARGTAAPQFDVPAYKVASASLTDDELLRAMRA
ncbi:hypothetical protein AB0C60_25120, partial [Streptomyces sp. NPDC048845]